MLKYYKQGIENLWNKKQTVIKMSLINLISYTVQNAFEFNNIFIYHFPFNAAQNMSYFVLLVIADCCIPVS